ncbi:hypothetical protein DF185_14150 [Marinifilum breve]|uniref:Uncharacterized protein n=1 Tax=Marinifilum breve TaxID=2184082 RepID=A0A2V3ZVU3_9BACT|nr:hypothetical protein [Marinifilum breve]PXX99021.1 hypothetical protein DF185_14150 [Marinifilum breve]
MEYKNTPKKLSFISGVVILIWLLILTYDEIQRFLFLYKWTRINPLLPDKLEGYYLIHTIMLLAILIVVGIFNLKNFKWMNWYVPIGSIILLFMVPYISDFTRELLYRLYF